MFDPSLMMPNIATVVILTSQERSTNTRWRLIITEANDLDPTVVIPPKP
jgi:hypothetical protein